MDYNQHDELARLFARNMQLAQQQAPVQQQQSSVENEKSDGAIHYVSGHYTHTSHVRLDTTSELSASPPPPYREALMPEAMAELLRQHSIDPSALLPNQAHLFANADHEQRQRLVELWRIAPPSYPLEAHLSGTLQATSVEQEQAEARVRYEQNLQARPYPPEEHMLDTTIVEPISPIREAGEPAWPPAARMRAASIAAKLAQSQAQQLQAEPYIVSGYQSGQHAQAVDPVYAAAAGLWQAPSYAAAVQEHQQQQPSAAMEHQYGMYEQIRNHADWEAMNERMARERFGGMQGLVDDEMMQ